MDEGKNSPEMVHWALTFAHKKGWNFPHLFEKIRDAPMSGLQSAFISPNFGFFFLALIRNPPDKHFEPGGKPPLFRFY